MTSIKKIKNLKFSESKNQEEAKWVELLSRRNRLLMETDWTQLPDVKLSERSRNEWRGWRQAVRLLNRIDYESSAEFKKRLDDLERGRSFIHIEYSYIDSITDLTEGKKFLHKILVRCFEERVYSEFTPNLEEKYQEALDVVARYLTSQDAGPSNPNLEEIIEIFEGLDDSHIDYDINDYQFLKVVQRVKNYSFREIVIYILKQKHKQYNLSLQEEYNMLHYEHRIDSCSDLEDLVRAKREIEMFYGH